MERTSAEITRYTSGDFEIDVADTGTMFEAWIGHKVIVIKELMFAVPHENTTKEEFLEEIKRTLPRYKKTFLEGKNI